MGVLLATAVCGSWFAYLQGRRNGLTEAVDLATRAADAEPVGPSHSALVWIAARLLEARDGR
jgi:hypothetical protein